ncbi:UNVERIFIED_CONTAM: Retrovirus-related Pol polyprotein from transposon RE1 [Sesamum radiatum]|uniref:Retrovirus-related Pol polyprotein from transposon RE1 n=1 Tax=Sesamum radiatum TaxID=300843 RepID=A0AAW2U0D6_SESRA
MDPSEGYNVVQPGQVCRLKCCLYGLKQVSSQCNLELTAKLLEYGFSQSSHSRNDFSALLVYVDDILLTGTSKANLLDVKQYLNYLFTIKDLGNTKYFLRLELARSAHRLLVTQDKYL